MGDETDRDEYQRLVELLPLGIQECDTEGTITLSNPAHCRMHGFEPGELLGRKIWELIAEPGDVDSFREYFATLVRDQPEPTRYLGQDRHRDGSRIDVQVDWDYKRGASGELLGFVCILRDVTEQLRLQKAAEEESFRELVSHIPVGIFQNDATGACTFVNPCGLEIMGRGLEEALGHAWMEGLHPEDRDRVAEAWEATRATGGEFHLEYRFRHPSGEVRWVTGHVVPRVEGDETVGYLGYVADITRRKAEALAREELEERLQQNAKMHALGNLAGQVAHDFNNILSGIQGCSDVLLDCGDLPEPDRELVETIQSCVRRGAAVVRAILDFARQEREGEEMILLDLRELLGDVAAAGSTIMPDEIEFHVEIPESPVLVLGCAERIRNAVENLLANARHAMGGGPGEIRVRIHEAEEIVLEVEDDGCGIPPDLQQRIWEPFFSTRVSRGGSGLGLASVHFEMGRHGGRAEVESTPGVGSRFRLCFPVPDVSQTGPGVEPHSKVLATGEPKVLLVDDEPVLVSSLCRLLERRGVRPLGCRSGREALELVGSHALDLAVLDVNMPVMTGPELARRLRELRPELPVIFVTGNPETLSREELPVGSRVLTKPLSIRVLLPAILESIGD